MRRELSEVDREIASTLLDTGAVNFEAIGQTIAKVGGKAILTDDDGWIRFCGSDLRIYRWPASRFELEELIILRDIVRQLPGKQVGG
jgi:hypothetical protein